MSSSREERWSCLSQGIPSYLTEKYKPGQLRVSSASETKRKPGVAISPFSLSGSSAYKLTPRGEKIQKSLKKVDMASAQSKSTQATTTQKGKLSGFNLTGSFHPTPSYKHSRTSTLTTPFKLATPFSDLASRAVQLSDSNYTSPTPRRSSIPFKMASIQRKKTEDRPISAPKRSYSLNSLSIKYGNVSPRIDCNGYGRGSLIYRSIADDCVEQREQDQNSPASPSSWKEHWYYITSSPVCRRFLWRNEETKLKEYKAKFISLHGTCCQSVEELRQSSLVNVSFERIMEVHRFCVSLLSKILSHYDSERDLFKITMDAYKQGAQFVGEQSQRKLLLQRLGFTLWSEKPVRATIEFLLNLLEAVQMVLLMPEKTKHRDSQEILYEGIIEAFLLKHNQTFPLQKVVQLSKDACKYFRINSKQLEEELAHHASSNALINQFNQALHNDRVYLVDKLRDLTGIDLILSRRHAEGQIFIIPRDSPYQLLHIISLIPSIDGEALITNLKLQDELHSTAKYIPYYFKFQMPSAFPHFASSLVAFDKYLSKALRLTLKQFLEAPIPAPGSFAKSPKRKDRGQQPSQGSVCFEIMFCAFLKVLRNELAVNGGEAGYRALRGVLRDKHYEKLLQHLLYSQALMNAPARYLLLQLLESLLIVIVRSKEFDYRSFCKVAERILSLKIREASQVLNDDIFFDKTVIWELRQLNAQINEAIFGVRILPSLTFVKEEIRRILECQERNVFVVEGLPPRVWSFYSPACNYIFIGDQDSLGSRSVKLRLARSVVRDVALAKSHLLACFNREFVSPTLNQGMKNEITLLETVQRLYQAFKAYTPGRKADLTPTRRASPFKSHRQMNKYLRSTAQF